MPIEDPRRITKAAFELTPDRDHELQAEDLARFEEIVERIKEGARKVNQSLENEGKVLRTEESIELAARQVAALKEAMDMVTRQHIVKGFTTASLTKSLVATCKLMHQVLHSVGFYDRLADDE